MKTILILVTRAPNHPRIWLANRSHILVGAVVVGRVISVADRCNKINCFLHNAGKLPGNEIVPVRNLTWSEIYFPGTFFPAKAFRLLPINYRFIVGRWQRDCGNN